MNIVTNFETRIMHRPGYKDKWSSSQERFSLDFILNGAPLSDLVQLKRHDMMGCFAYEHPEANKQMRDIFLLEAEPILDSGRISIFICAECGDIGCGAITMQIARKETAWIWKNFAWQNEIDKDDFESYVDVGPFVIEDSIYRPVLQAAGNIKSYK